MFDVPDGIFSFVNSFNSFLSNSSAFKIFDVYCLLIFSNQIKFMNYELNSSSTSKTLNGKVLKNVEHNLFSQKRFEEKPSF